MKCSVFIATSLDGCISRANGNIDWLISISDAKEDYGYNAFYQSTDCLVIGRKTYETALSFGQWPYENKKVIVLTSNPSTINKRLGLDVQTMSLSPLEILKTLESNGYKHAYIDGGKTIQSFLNEGLINEITITFIPILIGDGIRLFGPLNSDIILKHIETKTYSNGFVQIKYALSIF